MKKLLQLVIMLVSLFVMSISAYAADSLIDNARLLNAQDRITVQKAIKQVEDTYGVRTAVVTIRDSKVTEIGKYANLVLDRNYRNGRNGNMVLVINIATRKWYISRDNNMGTKITQSYGAKLIDQAVLNQLKNANYKDAFIAYTKLAGEQLSYFKKYGKAMAPSQNVAPATAKQPTKEKGHNIPMALGGGALVGAIAAFVYGGSLKASMSNVAFAARADPYMKPGSFQLTEEDDTFMYFTYTRVPKPKARREEVADVSDRSEDASDNRHDGEGGSF